MEVLALRRKLRLNQADFWNPLGVTQSGGSRYENERTIPAPVLRLIHIAYGTEAISSELVKQMRSHGKNEASNRDAQSARKPALAPKLTRAQREFLTQLEQRDRAEAEDYFRRKAATFVTENREVGEAGAFALAVVENPEFWMGCYQTRASALAWATRLGLPVTDGPT